MYRLIGRSVALLSILTLLPLAGASAAQKGVALVLMDGGSFSFLSSTSAELVGKGLSTHLGKIVSGGQFNNVGGLPSGCFKGEINGIATASNGDTLTYFLSAKFCPDPASGVFNGIGTYRITGGTGRFARARGFGQFIGLADFRSEPYQYQCFLSGTISYK